MIEIKILKPTTDFDKFVELMNKFKQRAETSRTTFNIDNIENYISYITDKFIKSDPKFFIVATVLYNEEVISFHIGATLATLYNREEVMPTWYYLLAYNDEKTLKIAGESIGRLGVVLMNHFEDINYYSFYATTRLPLNLLNAEDIDEYLDKVFQKNYPIFRYKRFIEQIILNQEKLTELRNSFTGYNLLLPTKCSRPLVLMKYEMINRFRNF